MQQSKRTTKQNTVPIRTDPVEPRIYYKSEIKCDKVALRFWIFIDSQHIDCIITNISQMTVVVCFVPQFHVIYDFGPKNVEVVIYLYVSILSDNLWFDDL